MGFGVPGLEPGLPAQLPNSSLASAGGGDKVGAAGTNPAAAAGADGLTDGGPGGEAKPGSGGAAALGLYAGGAEAGMAYPVVLFANGVTRTLEPEDFESTLYLKGTWCRRQARCPSQPATLCGADATHGS